MTEQDRAFDIIKFIVDEGLTAGDKLPSIRALSTKWDCSPSEVRSALITCSALGIIKTHPRAGSFMCQLDDSRVADLFALLIRLGLGQGSQRLTDIYQLKTMMDVELCALAAQYRTPEDLIELKQIIDRQEESIDNAADFIRADEAFHLIIAKISRNDLAVTLLDILQAMLRADRLSNADASRSRPAVINDHRNLLAAIQQEDVEQTRDLARQHSMRRVRELSA